MFGDLTTCYQPVCGGTLLHGGEAAAVPVVPAAGAGGAGGCGGARAVGRRAPQGGRRERVIRRASQQRRPLAPRLRGGAVWVGGVARKRVEAIFYLTSITILRILRALSRSALAHVGAPCTQRRTPYTPWGPTIHHDRCSASPLVVSGTQRAGPCDTLNIFEVSGSEITGFQGQASER